MTNYHDKDEAIDRIDKKLIERGCNRSFGDFLKLPPEERKEIAKQIQEIKKKARLQKNK